MLSTTQQYFRTSRSYFLGRALLRLQLFSILAKNCGIIAVEPGAVAGVAASSRLAVAPSKGAVGAPVGTGKSAVMLAGSKAVGPLLRRIVQYTTIYVATLVAANIAVAWLGPSAMPVIAFFLIGLDLTLRDRLHDQWRGRNLWPRMFALIATAGLVSYLLNPVSGSIAVASVVAFSLSSLADAVAYHLLNSRSWSVRANGSNVVGAVVDSIIFPLLAFGIAVPSIVLAQLSAKIVGGMLWAVVIAVIVRSRGSRMHEPAKS